MGDELPEGLRDDSNALVEREKIVRDFHTRDVWDKFSIINKFLSGVVVVILVAWINIDYNKRQQTRISNEHEQEMKAKDLRHEREIKLKELQIEEDKLKNEQEAIARAYKNRIEELEVVREFIPLLTSGTKDQQGLAIKLIHELGSPKVAEMVAGLYKTDATVDAIDNLRANALPPEQVSVPDPVKSSLKNDTETRLGWVYLGIYNNDQWKKWYLDFNKYEKPEDLKNSTFNVRVETGALNVRNGPPSFLGQLKEVIDVLEEESEVRILSTKSYPISGAYWAEVEYKAT